MSSFDGQIALIIGGSGDIACAAEKILSAGAKVVLSSRNKKRLKAICTDFEKKGFVEKISYVVCDAQNYESCVRMAEEVKKILWTDRAGFIHWRKKRTARGRCEWRIFPCRSVCLVLLRGIAVIMHIEPYVR